MPLSQAQTDETPNIPTLGNIPAEAESRHELVPESADIGIGEPVVSRWRGGEAVADQGGADQVNGQCGGRVSFGQVGEQGDEFEDRSWRKSAWEVCGRLGTEQVVEIRQPGYGDPVRLMAISY